MPRFSNGNGPNDPYRLSHPTRTIEHMFDHRTTTEPGPEEPDGRSLPVLLRQYLKLGAEVLETGVDAAFSDVVDALVLVDLDAVEPARLAKFMGPEGAAAFRAGARRRGSGSVAA